MLNPGSFVSPMSIFLLFLERNLFLVFVPFVYVHQLFGIPLTISFVTHKPFLHNDILIHTCLGWWFSAVVASFVARTKLLNVEPG